MECWRLYQIAYVYVLMFAENVITMCLLDVGDDYINLIPEGSRYRVLAIIWIDAVGVVTKVMIMLIDPSRRFFTSGFSRPREIASHVGKENRAGPAIKAITAQYPGLFVFQLCVCS